MPAGHQLHGIVDLKKIKLMRIDTGNRDIIDGNADIFTVLRDLCCIHNVSSFFFSSKSSANHPRTGVGGNSCADAVNCRRFIAKLTDHQTAQFLQTVGITAIDKLEGEPGSMSAILISATFSTNLRSPLHFAAVGMRPDLAAYFKS